MDYCVLLYIFSDNKEFVMKKQLLVLCCMIVASDCAYGLTEKETLKGLVSNHTRALDCRNMYDKQLNNQDIALWNDAIMNVKAFVASNSKKYKKKLMRYFDRIYRTNIDLINDIKVAYGLIMGGELNTDVWKQFADRFAAMDNTMKQFQSELGLIVGKTQEEQQAIKLVSALAKFVGVTARKAGSNLDSARNK